MFYSFASCSVSDLVRLQAQIHLLAAGKMRDEAADGAVGQDMWWDMASRHISPWISSISERGPNLGKGWETVKDQDLFWQIAAIKRHEKTYQTLYQVIEITTSPVQDMFGNQDGGEEEEERCVPVEVGLGAV